MPVGARGFKGVRTAMRRRYRSAKSEFSVEVVGVGGLAQAYRCFARAERSM